MEIVAAPDNQGEMRLDSRALADRMGNAHKNVLALISRHEHAFQGFGHLAFQTETVKNSAGAANQTKYALLNEDQCYFLLTLVRNSDTTVPMKAAVVAAFAKARQLLRQRPPRQDLPALITAADIGLSVGKSRNAVLNDLSRRAHIPAVASGISGGTKTACYLFPLDKVADYYSEYELVLPFQPYTGRVVKSPRAALSRAQRGVRTRTGHTQLPSDMDVDTLARVIAVAVKAALA